MNFAMSVGLATTLVGLMAATMPPAACAAPKTPAASNAAGLVDAATSDAAMREAFLKTGQRLADFCANCHGANGISNMSDVPNLASQNVNYLFEQMRKYVAGERRDNSKFKVGLIKLLKPEEKAAVAYYYAQSPVIPARTAPGPNAAKGKAVYTTRCAQCHGDDGVGAETIPRVAGQQTEYLRLSLESYRKKTSPHQLLAMVESMRGMTTDELGALVDYLASMR